MITSGLLDRRPPDRSRQPSISACDPIPLTIRSNNELPSSADMASQKDTMKVNDPESLSSERSNTVGEMEIQSNANPGSHLRREFKSRQVNMLAIAGAIGTDLIIGSGQGLARGGPASLFIAYCITGAIIYFVMTALGEMASLLPMDQGFNGYATRFVDPALGYEDHDYSIITCTKADRFATGWNYFFKYAIVLANNLNAAGLITQYWRPDLSTAIWVTVFGVAIVAINVYDFLWLLAPTLTDQ